VGRSFILVDVIARVLQIQLQLFLEKGRTFLVLFLSLVLVVFVLVVFGLLIGLVFVLVLVSPLVIGDTLGVKNLVI